MNISLINRRLLLSAVILFAFLPMSFADGNSFTVNIPNSQGGYTAIVLQQSDNGYIGPQGEFYTQFPSVAQLQQMYGAGVSNVITSTDADEDQSDSNIQVTVEPPALPDYDLPDAPGPDYIWTPGYWAYNSFFQDYYWVPGTWALPPTPGYLWTPGYWYWNNGRYIFSQGYWGVHVGFYGGVCYGYGYQGRGYDRGDHHRRGSNASSYNGGPHGTQARPSHDEIVFMKEKHVGATPEQRQHFHAASNNPSLRASFNHGKPAIAATSRPGVFSGKGVVVTKQAEAFYNKTKPNQFHVAKVITVHVTARPVVYQSVVKKSVVRKPVVEKPLVQQPIAQEPVVERAQSKIPSMSKDSKNKNSQDSN